MTSLIRVGDQTDILGECPLWHELEQALYWVDIRAPAIRRLDHASGRVESWPMPDLVGSIAFVDDGRLLVALPQELLLFDPATGAKETFARPPRVVPGHRFNDARCDRQGRFWVGSMHNLTRAPEGELFRLDGDGRLTVERGGIAIPNSLAFSPDGRTMYFADSLRHAIEAYDYDPATGRMGAARTFATTTPPAFPDGSAVDAEGGLWNAEFNGGRVVRYDPNGRVVATIDLPVRRPTCVTFGGPDLDLLFITTTSQAMTAAERAAEPWAGALLALPVGVRGLPETRFALPRAAGREATNDRTPA